MWEGENNIKRETRMGPAPMIVVPPAAGQHAVLAACLLFLSGACLAHVGGLTGVRTSRGVGFRYEAACGRASAQRDYLFAPLLWKVQTSKEDLSLRPPHRPRRAGPNQHACAVVSHSRRCPERTAASTPRPRNRPPPPPGPTAGPDPQPTMRAMNGEGGGGGGLAQGLGI